MVRLLSAKMNDLDERLMKRENDNGMCKIEQWRRNANARIRDISDPGGGYEALCTGGGFCWLARH